MVIIKVCCLQIRGHFSEGKPKQWYHQSLSKRCEENQHEWNLRDFIRVGFLNLQLLAWQGEISARPHSVYSTFSALKLWPTVWTASSVIFPLVFTSLIKTLYRYVIHWTTRSTLTAHNWQKLKSTFLTYPCHKIYRVEAVGLKSSNYTLKITIFVNMWNLEQLHENLTFNQ